MLDYSAERGHKPDHLAVIAIQETQRQADERFDAGAASFARHETDGSCRDADRRGGETRRENPRAPDGARRRTRVRSK